MRPQWVVGNWKMNHGAKETRAYFESIAKLAPELISAQTRKMIEDGMLRSALLPPFLSLVSAVEHAGRFQIQTGSQNASAELSGAHTGEVSGPMLKEIGVSLTLVGHSERRAHYGETDEGVYRRAKSLLSQGFTVIVCVGETRAEYESGKRDEILERQVRLGINDLVKDEKLVVAYEPVWAIGTGLAATPKEIASAHGFLRNRLSSSILYGGSISVENAASIFSLKDVDGGLVGGASLRPDGFLKLVEIAGQSALSKV